MEKGHTARACDVCDVVVRSLPLNKYRGRSLHHRVGCCPLAADPYLVCWEVVWFLWRDKQHYCGISEWDESLKLEPHQKEDVVCSALSLSHVCQCLFCFVFFKKLRTQQDLTHTLLRWTTEQHSSIQIKYKQHGYFHTARTFWFFSIGYTSSTKVWQIQ